MSGRSARYFRCAGPVLALTLGVVLVPALLFASEGGHGEGHATDWKTLIIASLNFGVLLFVLRRFAGPAVQGFFFQRSEAIRKQLEESQSRLRAAEAELEDLRRRLRSIDGETQKLVSRVTEQAEQERQRSLQRAEQTAQRIREEAQRIAERELERARTALQSEASALAAKLAAELLREQVRPEDHARLVTEFIERVESSRP